jgi:hypothetical protein
MEVTPCNNDPTKQLRPRRRGFKSSLAYHWSEIDLEIRHQFHTSILLLISKRQYESSEAMRILNIRQVISK